MSAYKRLGITRIVASLALALTYAMQANTGVTAFCLTMAALFAWDTRTPYNTY